MQYPDDYRMQETKIMKFERDYDNSLEYTFFDLFPQNVASIQVGYEGSKILTASATFEYTRYVSGPISNISKFRSGQGYNNLTVNQLKDIAQKNLDISNNNPIIPSDKDGTVSTNVDSNEALYIKNERQRIKEEKDVIVDI